MSKLENIISGHKINQDDADWLRALAAHEALAAAPAEPAGTIADNVFIEQRGDGIWLVCLEKVYDTREGASVACQFWKRRAPHQPSIDAMVNRFLGWRLPDDFGPDCGISFSPIRHHTGEVVSWPIGTNLLTANQAKAMFEYVLREREESANPPTTKAVDTCGGSLCMQRNRCSYTPCRSSLLAEAHPAPQPQQAGVAATMPTPAYERHLSEGKRPLRLDEPVPPSGPQVAWCDKCGGCYEWGGNGLWHHAGCSKIPDDQRFAWLETAAAPPPQAPAPAPQAQAVSLDVIAALQRVELKFGRFDDGSPKDWQEWVDFREALAVLASAAQKEPT